MKLKITIWLEDKEMVELDYYNKLDYKEQIKSDIRINNPDAEIKQIEIEETEYED